MMNRVYSVACALYWVVLFNKRLVLAHAVQAAGGAKTNIFVSSAAFFSLPRTILSSRRYLQTREEQGRRSRAFELHQSRDGGSVVPPSCDYSPSFVQKRVDAENDVSCFSHDNNVGSLATEHEVLDAPTVLDCYRSCHHDEKCSHFTWNKESHKCYLKAGPPEFYDRVDDVTGPHSCDTTCFVGCVTYNTNPMMTLDWSRYTPALCQAACWARKDCQAFVLDNGKCKLFGKGFSAYRVVSGGDTIAGPRNPCEEPSDLRLRELYDGHRIGSCMKSDNIGSRSPEIGNTTEAPTLAACQQRCKSNGRCQHFTYSLISKLCYLKDDVPPDYYPMVGDVTGDKDCVPD